MNISYSEIFSRSAILYGNDALERIANASISLCGLGAVGGYTLEVLARLGVGNFRLFDFDTVEPSNINRQLCALTSTVGKLKTELWRERILDINPKARVEIFNEFIDAANIDKIVSGVDVVVDAIDTISSKALVIEGAWKASVAVVSSMGAARRVNPLNVCVADIFKTKFCPLASRLRKELRKVEIKGECQCVYSNEALLPETHLNGDGENAKKIIGSSPIVTGVFGLNLANLALIKILEKK